LSGYLSGSKQPWDKFNAISSEAPIQGSGPAAQNQQTNSASDPSKESFKVIALDKVEVNNKLW